MEHKILSSDLREILEESKEIAHYMNSSLESLKINLIPIEFKHSVFKLQDSSSLKNFYLKFGNFDEFKLESEWYNRLHLIGSNAPNSEIFKLDKGKGVIITDEVIGTEAAFLINQNKDTVLLDRIIEEAGKVSRQMYDKVKDEMPKTYFGEFDYENGMKLAKGITADLRHSVNGQENSVENLSSFLDKFIKKLSNEQKMFYLDSIANNFIVNPSNELVHIDLGSTAYRPPQFELVALINTPYLKINYYEKDLPEKIDLFMMNVYPSKQSSSIINRIKSGKEYEISKQLQKDLGFSREHFQEVFYEVQFLKNLSGFRTRINYIKGNIENLIKEPSNILLKNNLQENIIGKEYHLERVWTSSYHVEGNNLLSNTFDFDLIEGAMDEINKVYEASENFVKEALKYE